MEIRIDINYQKGHMIVFVSGANLISMAPYMLPKSSNRAKKSCGLLNQTTNNTATSNSTSMEVGNNPTVMDIYENINNETREAVLETLYWRR